MAEDYTRSLGERSYGGCQEYRTTGPGFDAWQLAYRASFEFTMFQIKSRTPVIGED